MTGLFLHPPGHSRSDTVSLSSAFFVLADAGLRVHGATGHDGTAHWKRLDAARADQRPSLAIFSPLLFSPRFASLRGPPARSGVGVYRKRLFAAPFEPFGAVLSLTHCHFILTSHTLILLLLFPLLLLPKCLQLQNVFRRDPDHYAICCARRHLYIHVESRFPRHWRLAPHPLAPHGQRWHGQVWVARPLLLGRAMLFDQRAFL